MRYLRYISLLFLCLYAASCTEDKVDVFGEERYIFFRSLDGSRELSYTFKAYPGEDELEVLLPVSYSGRMYSGAENYSVQVSADNTTADESEYDFPSSAVFKAGVYEDSLKVVLKRTPRLADKTVRLSLRLVSNDVFTAAVRDSLVMDIYFSDMLSRPSWWTENVTKAYLGEYSDKKYELFIQHGYSGDYGALSESEKLHYARVFKKWLESQNPPVTEEDGTLMEVPVVG